MIATTISNSIREKPFCFFMTMYLLETIESILVPEHTYTRARQLPNSNY
jgi:hypothetical protein